MEDYTVEECRRIRWSVEHESANVLCPRCLPRFGPRAHMVPVSASDTMTMWHCGHCGQTIKVPREQPTA